MSVFLAEERSLITHSRAGTYGEALSTLCLSTNKVIADMGHPYRRRRYWPRRGRAWLIRHAPMRWSCMSERVMQMIGLS